MAGGGTRATSGDGPSVGAAPMHTARRSSLRAAPALTSKKSPAAKTSAGVFKMAYCGEP
jgi:hypothetical protein